MNSLLVSANRIITAFYSDSRNEDFIIINYIINYCKYKLRKSIHSFTRDDKFRRSETRKSLL